MSVLYKELLIIDKDKRIARKICFAPGINIVTSKQNSVGKTSLSLMLLYSFGAKVLFSDKWNLDSIVTKLVLSSDGKEITIVRYKDSYSIHTECQDFNYPVQKYGYSDKLYELLGLSIKVKDKNSDSYSTAVPSLYLLPYFLSQTKTDDERSVFIDLHMYSKTDLHDAMYYHVGTLDNHYTTILQQLSRCKAELEKLREAKNKQVYEIEYLEDKLRENKNSIVSESATDVDTDVAILENFAKKKQDYYLLVKQEAEIKRKIKLLNKSLADNVTYTNKVLGEDTIICPVCKTDITDFISSALSIETAQNEIDAEIIELKADLLLVHRKVLLAKQQVEQLHSQVVLIESQRENVRVTRAIAVWSEELRIAKQKFSETQLLIDNHNETLKKLNAQMHEYGKKKVATDEQYIQSFSSLLNKVNINMNGVDLRGKGLFDSISLGGSEIPRVAIAKFFALLESKKGNSIVMPIIFDFPNLDMTTENIVKCFQLMCEKISDTKSYPQSFVFSIDCNERIKMAGCSLENTNCIDLGKLDSDDTEHPILLCKNDYIKYSSEIIPLMK